MYKSKQAPNQKVKISSLELYVTILLKQAGTGPFPNGSEKSLGSYDLFENHAEGL